jgi:hypothetical protein
MKNYRFTIEIPAKSQLEAEVKLNLLLEMGAFFKDFNASRLTSSFLNYYLLYLADKCSPQAKDTSNNKQR